MKSKLLAGVLAVILMPPATAVSHPHVFIDAGATLIFDQDGQLAAVRITWAYDEFYSLLETESRGLDEDFDGALTPEEEEVLSGFDMQWLPDFDGDSYASIGDNTLSLSGPLEWTAGMVDGRIVTTHIRALERRVTVGAEPVSLKIYDPTYYNAYYISLPTRLENAPDGCSTQVFEPDPEAMSEQLRAAIIEFAGLPDDEFEAEFPAIGAYFAEEIRLTCAPQPS